MTVGDLIEQLAQRFAAAGLVFGHGTDDAWDEAVALVLGVTQLPDDRGVLQQRLPPAVQQQVERLAARRIDERIPLAYLLGSCRFAGRDFLIEPGVVIPRSPIGALLEARLAPWLEGEPQRIVDLCCGSGCLGIIAALAFPHAQVDLVDLDQTALGLARRNVALHGLEARVRVQQSDLFDDLPQADEPAGTWDLIVTNPPYVDRADMSSLPAEYRHEPALGLAGGADGLDLVARMLEALPQRLAPGGTFVCEVGASAPALLRRFPCQPFIWPDLPHGGEGVFILFG
ncbi:MAG: 50S ribosomal protein L3 N(5)-glutamine methyltransferase [Pseudomonadales bacterium]